MTASTPAEPALAPGRIRAVDGLRGIAVLLVLVHHFVALQLTGAIGSWQAYLAAGLGLTFSGVDLFFVLSGFLIGGILLDHREAPNFFQVFYVRRTLRIIPLYYLFLAVCWVLSAQAEGVRPPTYSLGAYVTFLCNFSMTAGNAWDAGWPALAWSLAVEEQFYLVFPLLVRFCSPGILLSATLASLVVAPLLRVALLLWAPQYALGSHVLAPCRMDSLAFGILVAFGLRLPRWRAWLVARPQIPALLAAALLPVLAYLTWRRAAVPGLPLAVYGYTAFGAFYAAVLLAVLGGRPRWLAEFCRSRALVFVGGISYFVYLFQGVAAWAVFRVFHRPTLSLASSGDAILVGVAVVGLLAAGAISWHLFESRLVGRGRRFRYLPPVADPA